MTILSIRQFGDPVLKEPCRDVEDFDASLRRLYDDMLETMYDAPGVGLAAPQVGLSQRFFVYDPAPKDEEPRPGAVANPVLSGHQGEQTDDEGCLSIPNLWFPTARAMRVRVTGQDLDGNATALEGEGLLARIFQHETDHLHGTLFLDRLSDEDRRQAMAAIRDRELAGRSRWRRRR
jgi:peptide deformylase